MRELHPIDQDLDFGRCYLKATAITQVAATLGATAFFGGDPAVLGWVLVSSAALAAAPTAILVCALLARWITGHPTAAQLWPEATDPVRGDPSRGPLLRRLVLRFKRLVHRFRPLKTLFAGAFTLVIAWTLAVYLIICFGAPAFSAHSQTSSFAVLLVTYIVLPTVLIYGPEDREALLRVFFVINESDPLAQALFVSAAWSVAGAWVGAFPIPLDWDRPWQEWPITCCLGLYGGHFLGSLIALVSLELQRRRRNRVSLAKTSKKKKS